jgi:hypothetical protein
MADHHRIQLYWPPRADPRSELARQVAAFLAQIAPIHPDLSRFLYDDARSGEPTPAASPADCDAALEQGKVIWRSGARENTSYERRFYVDRKNGSPVAFTITCGIEPLGLDPIWTPNRLDFLVRADVGDERASRPVLEAVLRAAVGVFRPDWAFAGTDRVPTAPLALFSDGTPVVGWMTYLRAGFPEVPPTLPQPAVVYPITVDGALGTLIVAHPELFHDRDPAQRAAIDRVSDALRAAGVLVPPSRLPGR